jgi:hypothetical protein
MVPKPDDVFLKNLTTFDKTSMCTVCATHLIGWNAPICNWLDLEPSFMYSCMNCT